MEALLPAAQHDGPHAAFGPKPFSPGDGGGSFSSPNNLLTNDGDLIRGGYSAHPFGSGPARSASSSDTGSVVDEGDDDSLAAAEHRARLALLYREAANRYHLCLTHLADACGEAAALRRENDRLRFSNADLARRIALVGGKHGSALALADELRRLALDDQLRRLTLAEEQAEATPSPPPPPAPMTRPVPAAMPKSISVRSTGYLKATNPSGTRRVPNTENSGSQRVFVGTDGGGAGKGEVEANGEEEEQGAAGVEFEVYDQGMFKTELCNRWAETGACTYGDHCQFAHGVAELRPVIRHPRYKTQVCRMVLAGNLCPYGHRCHFRHSITPADAHQLRH